MNNENEALHSDNAWIETPNLVNATEETSETEQEIFHEEDFSTYTKEELLHYLEKHKADVESRELALALKKGKVAFDELVQHEREEALGRFVAEGNDKNDFDFRKEPVIEEFYKLHKDLSAKRKAHFVEQDKNKQRNYETKVKLLDMLRALVDAEETKGSMAEFQKIQQEWKSAGYVTPQQNKTLWANYHALVEQFYSKRSIYFELKELDRKKNLAHKVAVCEKAEALAGQDLPLNQLLRELQRLHDDYKHIGPVPKEDQEAVWQRFKAASDQIYDKKDALVKQSNVEREANLTLKAALCQKMEALAAFQSDRITEWNAKTQEVIQLQKEWEKIRLVPRDKIKEVSKLFWHAFKTFFVRKGEFFKQIDAERDNNLKRKQALCEEATQLTNSEAPADEIARKLIDLQKNWKEIGSVPPRYKNSIFEQFKKICDSFFDKRRQNQSVEEKTFEENLAQKQAILAQINAFQPTNDQSWDSVDDFIEAFNAIGFVPIQKKKGLLKDFQKVLTDLAERFPALNEEGKESNKLKMELKINKENPANSRRFLNEDQKLRSRIDQLENDLNTLNNNLGFFAGNKNKKSNNDFLDSVNKQVAEKTEELAQLKKKLKLLREMQKNA